VYLKDGELVKAAAIQDRITNLTQRILEATSEPEIRRLRHEQDKLLDRMAAATQPSEPAHL
jgi:hypothetical protein